MSALTPEANMSTQTTGSGTDPSKSELGHNPSILFCGRHPPKQTVRLSRTVRHTTLHGRNEWPPSNVRPTIHV